MQKYHTIGIGGQLANGKDEGANYLAAGLNKMTWEEWRRNAFANKVKETFERAFGVAREFTEKWKRIEEAPPGFAKNVRQCLIGIGDGFRQMYPMIWIEQAFKDQTAHQIISDCRYINECNHINDREGITILLWRPGYQNTIPNDSEQQYGPFIQKLLSAKVEGVVKDSDIPFHLFLRNEGTIEDLQNKVDQIVIPFIESRWRRLFRGAA